MRKLPQISLAFISAFVLLALVLSLRAFYAEAQAYRWRIYVPRLDDVSVNAERLARLSSYVEKAVELEAGNADYWSLKGALHTFLAEHLPDRQSAIEQYALAESAYRQASVIQPYVSRHYAGVAVAGFRQLIESDGSFQEKNFQPFCADYQKALALNPQNQSNLMDLSRFGFYVWEQLPLCGRLILKQAFRELYRLNRKSASQLIQGTAYQRMACLWVMALPEQSRTCLRALQ